MYDVMVVGGGPAGLSGALTLARARRRVLLADGGDGRNAPADAVRNFVLHEGIAPAELRGGARRELARYPTVDLLDETVTGASGTRGDFSVILSDGTEARARRLLLATGVRDRLPPIEGLATLWGRSILHCPYCHGWEVRDEPLAALVLVPLDVYFAASLSRWSSDLVVLTGGAFALAEDQLDLLEATGAAVRDTPITGVSPAPDAAIDIHFEKGEPLRRRALFLHAPVRQRSELPGQLGCRILDDGYVEVDEFGQTTLPGVSSAGDMARRAAQGVPITFVAHAAAQGITAAVLLDQDLFFSDPSGALSAPRMA